MLQSSSSEKKLVKPLQNWFFGPNLHKEGVIMGHAQGGKKFFWQKYQKKIISFQKVFILSKYMFWLSYELLLSYYVFMVMSSLFIYLILKISHYLHMKSLMRGFQNQLIYDKRFSRYLHLKFEKEVYNFFRKIFPL